MIFIYKCFGYFFIYVSIILAVGFVLWGLVFAIISIIQLISECNK